jgi:hypothetical protein
MKGPPLGNKRDIVSLGDEILDNRDIDGILRSTASSWQYTVFQDTRELDYSYTLEKQDPLCSDRSSGFHI